MANLQHHVPVIVATQQPCVDRAHGLGELIDRDGVLGIKIEQLKFETGIDVRDLVVLKQIACGVKREDRGLRRVSSNESEVRVFLTRTGDYGILTVAASAGVRGLDDESGEVVRALSDGGGCYCLEGGGGSDRRSDGLRGCGNANAGAGARVSDCS